MARKRVEPFNPWPGFVDLFASVIMVVLMFMLVLIVNISYYSQFKYKIAYTGSVGVQKPISIIEQNKEKMKKESLLEHQTQKIVKDDSEKELEAIAGMDLTIMDTNVTRQENNLYGEWMSIKYQNKEIILDPPSVKDLERFIKTTKEKFSGHFISIYIKEPTNQISTSIAKQIAFSRALNIRNVIRKQGYKDEDVVVRLKEVIPQEKVLEHSAGYAIIVVNRKK